MDDLISRQAAIDILNEYFTRLSKFKRRGLNKGEQAISLDVVGAIKSLPSVYPEPCEDTISRADAIRIASGYCHPANVAKELAKLPSVQPDNSCDGCRYENADDGVLVPCGFCKRSHPDNYERRTDG